MTKRYPKEASQPKPPQQADSSSPITDASIRIFDGVQRHLWDVGGVVFLSIGLITLLALLDVTSGVLVNWWAGLLQRWFGWGSFLLVPMILAIGIVLLIQRSTTLENISWGRSLSLEMAAFAGLVLLAVIGENSLQRASEGLDGGLVGWGLAELLGTAIKPAWLLGVVLS